MKITLTAALAATVMMLTACGSSSPAGSSDGAGGSSGGTDKVTIGLIPIVDVAPVYVGEQQGFFASRNIELDIQTGQGGAAIVPGVVSGQFQFGFSNVTSLLLARTKGLPLKIVAAGDSSTGVDGTDFGAVVVGADSSVTDAAGLAGRSVAVNTLNNIGTTTVNEAVRKGGADPSGINYVELGFPDMPAAVQAGRVDAAWLVEPFLSIAKSQGAKEVSSNFVATAPDLMISTYFTSEKLIADDPDLVARFTEAMNESLAYSQANPDAARSVLSEYTKIDQTITDALTLPLWPTDITTSSVQTLGDLAQQDGLLDGPADVSGLLP